MDNLTHSLIGAAVGETFFQVAKKNKSTSDSSRPYFYIISIIANNFPDTDLLYRFLDPSNLGYLLHHRGHTHTFIWLWAQLLILLFLGWAFLKIKKISLKPKEGFWLVVTAAVGLHLHIGMDFLNSYGVHPFHPVSNKWFYGDSIFIIEPLLWTFIIPMLYFSTKTFWRHIALTLCLVLIALGAYLNALNFISIFLIATLSLLGCLFMLKTNALKRALTCLLALVLTISSFYFSRGIAHNKIISETEKLQLSTVYDVVLSPLPANPFCWTLIFIDGDKNNYRLHRGLLNLLPNIANCPQLFDSAPRSLLRTPPELENTAYIDWIGFYKTTYRDLFEETLNNCQLKAWFQFARAPLKEGNQYGDVRFLSNKDSFAGFDTEKETGKNCPPYPAPWRPPFEYENLLKQALKNAQPPEI